MTLYKARLLCFCLWRHNKRDTLLFGLSIFPLLSSLFDIRTAFYSCQSLLVSLHRGGDPTQRLGSQRRQGLLLLFPPLPPILPVTLGKLPNFSRTRLWWHPTGKQRAELCNNLGKNNRKESKKLRSVRKRNPDSTSLWKAAPVPKEVYTSPLLALTPQGRPPQLPREEVEVRQNPSPARSRRGRRSPRWRHGPGKPLPVSSNVDPVVSLAQSLPVLRTSSLRNCSASLPAVHLLPAYLSLCHTPEFSVAVLDGFGYVYSLTKFLTHRSGIPSRSLPFCLWSWAPGRVTATGSCFPFQFRGQSLGAEPATHHLPPHQPGQAPPLRVAPPTQAPPTRPPPGAAPPSAPAPPFRVNNKRKGV